MSFNAPSNIDRSEKEPKYDAIVVLGAVMRWNAENKQWDFPTIMEPEEYSGRIVMGKARAIAASHIQADAEKLLVTGGSNVHPETGERASRSRELARLISEGYGVPPDKVIPMGTLSASHVMGNVENVIDYLEKNPAVLKRRRIAVLTPKFQSERAKEMFDANPYFKEKGIAIDWLIVEDVLAARHPMYKKWAAAVDATPEAATNRAMEKEGLKAFRDKKYKPKS